MVSALNGILDLLQKGQRGYELSPTCAATTEGTGPPTLKKLLGPQPDDTNPFCVLLARAEPTSGGRLVEERFRMAVATAFAIVADRARVFGSRQATPPQTHEEFVDNLIEMVTAAVSALPTPAPRPPDDEMRPR